MSNLGKFFVLLALLTSVAAVVLGVLLNNQKTHYANQLQKIESVLKQASTPYAGDFRKSPSEPASTVVASLEKLKELESTASARDQELEELKKTSTSTIESKSELQQTLEKTQQELTQTREDLDSTLVKLEEVQTRLQSVDNQLQGRSLEDIVTQFEFARTETGALRTEKKILEDKVSELVAEMDTIRNRNVAQTKPAQDVSGSVVAINRPWNFVVIDIGREQQLVEGVELSIYRGTMMIGKIRTVSIDSVTSVADIIPSTLQSEIQVGDRVTF